MDLTKSWFHIAANHSDTTTFTAVRNRISRVGSTGLLAFMLAFGTIGGGAVGSALTAQAFTAQAAQNSSSSTQPILQTAADNVAGAVLASAGPSVVEISTSVSQAGMRSSYTLSGTGSGFVVDASGLILTNNHVVEGASSVSVLFSNGQERTATVIGTDSTHDLALVQVADMPADIPAITLGDSDTVEVGETAIAIGSPFGLEQSVTQGIISAVDRTTSSSSSAMSDMIQTDTAINPGNSGGPLLNASGEVVGINTMIESPVEGNVGVGFAVPINVAKARLAQLESGVDVQQGYLGVSVQEADAGQSGVVVAAVQSGSGAAAAGLVAGDIITAIDGNTVTSYADLVEQITGKQPGEQVSVTVERSGAERQLSVTLQAG